MSTRSPIEHAIDPMKDVNPGIKDLVAALVAENFPIMLSGDGVTDFQPGTDDKMNLPYKHVSFCVRDQEEAKNVLFDLAVFRQDHPELCAGLDIHLISEVAEDGHIEYSLQLAGPTIPESDAILSQRLDTQESANA